MASVSVRVLYFAKSREVAGVAEETFAVAAPATTADLLAALVAKHPGLESVMRTCVLSLNQEYVGADEVVALKDNDEVAVIPPLSGG